jgi:two-component system cell cycle sensor histidine kinase/response regulator CckA
MGGRRRADNVDPTETDDSSSLKRAESDLRERELALARTNELLQLVLDTIPVRVFWKDLDLRYLGCNRLFAQDSGLTGPDDLIGLDDFAMGWRDQAEAYRADDAAVIEGGTSRVNYEEPQTTPDGEQIWLRTSKLPLRDLDGTIIGVLGTYEDITEEKRREERERQLQTEVQHNQKLESLGVLAGGIAHDFNNILTGILGQADLVLADLPPVSPVSARLEAIQFAATSASDLCRQMLAYSGKGRFVIAPLDLSEVVLEMRDMLEAVVSKKVTLRFDLASELPAVNADASQLQQIILNFVLNASEAIDNGMGVVGVHTGIIECDPESINTTFMDHDLSPGRYVTLEVTDTGCGMDKVTKERMFEPFFSSKFTGRGLGLSAVQGIVRGHKGAIETYSEPGRGTTMKVLLPASPLPSKSLSKPEDTARGWRGTGTVLVVDDESVVREVAQGMLERAGLNVLTAEDGREALVVFGNHADEINCVILDLTMPHLDGEETFRELRRIRPDVAVILASGYNQQDVTQRFTGKGLAGFLQKPFRLESLTEMVEAILDPKDEPRGRGH